MGNLQSNEQTIFRIKPNELLSRIDTRLMGSNWDKIKNDQKFMDILSFNFGKCVIYDSFIENNMDAPWNWNLLSETHVIKNEKTRYIFHCPNVSLQFVEKYPEKDWDWEKLTRHPEMNIDFLEKFHEKPIEWKKLNIETIPLFFISKYPEKDWDWLRIANRLTIRDIPFIQLFANKMPFSNVEKILDEYLEIPNRANRILEKVEKIGKLKK